MEKLKQMRGDFTIVVSKGVSGYMNEQRRDGDDDEVDDGRRDGPLKLRLFGERDDVSKLIQTTRFSNSVCKSE